MSQINEEISNYYKKFLDRKPDKKGLSYFLTKYQNGVSLEDIHNEIKYSEESQLLKIKKFEKKPSNLHSKKPDEIIQKTIQRINPKYHWMSINGIEIPNTRTSKAYQMWISQNIPEDLTNKTILDIGCADGFYSFLCESRNARKTIAIDLESFDIFKTKTIPKPNPNNFEILKNLLDSKVEYKKLDVYDVQKLNQTFDYVLMYGVYYHLHDFVLALQKISDIVTDSVFLSGHILDTDEPTMYYYRNQSESNPKKKFSSVVASANCLITIAQEICKFKTAECVDIMTTDYETVYAHNNGSTKGKIGLFKFSK
jgi:SAM-dependent methyltransferase